MSGHRAPTVTRRNGVFFRPDQPAYPRRPRHQRLHGQAGSWVLCPPCCRAGGRP